MVVWVLYCINTSSQHYLYLEKLSISTITVWYIARIPVTTLVASGWVLPPLVDISMVVCVWSQTEVLHGVAGVHAMTVNLHWSLTFRV